MADILQDTFEVTVDGGTYTFRIPSIKYRFEMASRASSIRSKGAQGVITQADYGAYQFSYNCAAFELYLVSSSEPWPYGYATWDSVDRAKMPAVDFEKWPSGIEDTVDAVAAEFENQRIRFRTGRNSGGRPLGAEAVAGGGGAGAP